MDAKQLPKDGEIVLAWWGDMILPARNSGDGWIVLEEGEWSAAVILPDGWVSLPQAKAAPQLAEALQMRREVEDFEDSDPTDEEAVVTWYREWRRRWRCTPDTTPEEHMRSTTAAALASAGL